MTSLLLGNTTGYFSLLGGPVRHRLARARRLLPVIVDRESALSDLSDDQLRKESLALRYRAKSGEPLDDLLPESFALVRTAAARTLGMRHYDVQITGGIAMHHRSIAEMQTGEGKTLTATLPVYLAALRGKGAHVATVNDYLARRDAEWMTPIYEYLGLSVGIIETQIPREQRRKAYACDVTYGTAKEFGFDFLRDRLYLRGEEEGESDLLGSMLGESDATPAAAIQRQPYFCLVDEADSIFIDEARTPLVISAMAEDDRNAAIRSYRWAATVCKRFVERDHYDYDAKKRLVTLNADGRRQARDLPKPNEMHDIGLYDIYQHVELAVKVDRDFIRDRHYIVQDDEVVIVDEFTGRLAEGRRWRAGLHQAVEAKERLEVTVESGQAARVTVQDYFLRYERLAGMTGTGSNSAAEMNKIYDLRVVAVPTNRPPIRQRLTDCVFATSDEKWRAIVDEVREVHAAGRPVLIGTRSIDKSEIISGLLDEAGIKHQILNARNLAQEAEIVTEAGQVGRVTVATNMAGRGTDIKLADEVQPIGGLHVICTELHDSARIDRQLIGRSGRQGDPGTFRQYLALDDDILQAGFGPKRAARLRRALQQKLKKGERLAALFRRAQARVEQQHFSQRKMLLHHEDQRKKIQQQMGQDPYLDTPG